MKIRQFLISALAIGLFSCQNDRGMNSMTAEQEEVFGEMPDGREVKIFTLINDHGLVAKVTEYGAILVSMETPDRAGNIADLTHGYDTLEGWLTNTSYFGATVGRFGNRIKDGKFTLDGKEYTLAKNNEPGGIPCHLHGGLKGFDKVLWSGKSTADNSVEFTYVSKDGEEGYPGTLTVKVTYTLNDDNELKWEATATTDAPTIINLVNHSYWNLSGDPTTSIIDHELRIAAPSFLPTDVGLIPTGEIALVKGTPLDFTSPHPIGSRTDQITWPVKQFYDHNFMVIGGGNGELMLAARVRDPDSNRAMEVWTTQPGVQLYTGNPRGFCLETQHFPDAINHPHFPSPIVRPNQPFRSATVFKFFSE